MRKIFTVMLICMIGSVSHAQDSLQTTTLKEVVVTGTKFQLSVEKSGKTIYKLDRRALEQNAGKSVADVLNEVPGVQTDGNFSAPGTNQSYYVRGGRNRQALVLIDGVPLNDPSSISAEYDLRYIPLSQIESIEVFKGGLSTLYGTSAAAGVINIRLKSSGEDLFGGQLDVSAGSFGTFSQNVHVNGNVDKFSYAVSANNLTSEGFSAAQDNDPLVDFDKDGISRQNFSFRGGYAISEAFKLDVHSAYEQFEAGYDDYEFADAPNTQNFSQWRMGLQPRWDYGQGEVEGKLFYNASSRIFESSFPEEDIGRNTQGEIIHRHRFSQVIQTLAGINYQHMEMEQKEQIGMDSASFTLLDPYVSVFVDLPMGLNVHAGARLNTHSLYGSQFIYNVNPSFVLNQRGKWQYKLLTSVSTSYITPSLYQMYSFYGNKELQPERSVNYETGISVYHDALTVNAVVFKREEKDPIDFVSLFDDEGNFIGGQYQNLVDEREVQGIEFDATYSLSKAISFSGNFAVMDSDKPASFYKIPKTKYGAAVTVKPLPAATLSVKYNFTGERKTFDFGTFSELSLAKYQLVDLFASYGFLENRLTLYGAVNNLFDEEFVALYGYTTRGRNFSIGLRYDF